MPAGPVFSRELVTAPRRPRFHIYRTVYVFALFLLMCTAWLVLAGTQVISNVGDMARFGSILFQILATLQLALVLFISAMLAASAVAQEKDKKTLILLLLTRLSNREVVLGKFTGQPVERAGHAGRRAPVIYVNDVVRWCFRGTDRTGLRGHVGDGACGGQSGINAGAMARKDISGLGADGPGARWLAGGWRSGTHGIVRIDSVGHIVQDMGGWNQPFTRSTRRRASNVEQ